MCRVIAPGLSTLVAHERRAPELFRRTGDVRRASTTEPVLACASPLRSPCPPIDGEGRRHG